MCSNLTGYPQLEQASHLWRSSLPPDSICQMCFRLTCFMRWAKILTFLARFCCVTKRHNADLPMSKTDSCFYSNPHFCTVALCILDPLSPVTLLLLLLLCISSICKMMIDHKTPHPLRAHLSESNTLLSKSHSSDHVTASSTRIAGPGALCFWSGYQCLAHCDSKR